MIGKFYGWATSIDRGKLVRVIQEDFKVYFCRICNKEMMNCLLFSLLRSLVLMDFVLKEDAPFSLFQ